jgi:hypothetical protein
VLLAWVRIAICCMVPAVCTDERQRHCHMSLHCCESQQSLLGICAEGAASCLSLAQYTAHSRRHPYGNLMASVRSADSQLHTSWHCSVCWRCPILCAWDMTTSCLDCALSLMCVVGSSFCLAASVSYCQG